MATSVMQEIADNVYAIDGAPVTYPGFEFPVRSIVVRLSTGELWVHSPVKLTSQVNEAVRTLGEPAHLVSPNKFHHLYMGEWREAFPNARMYASPGLAKKRSDLTFDETFSATNCPRWGEDITTYFVGGCRVCDEMMFVHEPSRVLIVTDYLMNLDTRDQHWFGRWFAKAEQIKYPNGGMPRLFRWFSNDKPAMRCDLRRVIDAGPERIVFSHGESFDENAVTVLEDKFSWLFNT